MTTFLFVNSFSQTQNLSLTEKNLKRLFNTPPDICCVPQKPEWTACYNTDSGYYKVDTVQLYSDKYYYLTVHCCYDIEWTFYNSTTFALSETKVCQEPPLSMVSFDNSNLKIKFNNKNNTLTMFIYKDRKLKDRFVLLSLDTVEMKNGQLGYRLTMLRRKDS
jgi:hypothetical protein